MQENLIYIGDTIRFSEEKLTDVNSINGIYRTIFSTSEANINSNVSLAFSRLDMRFRVKKDDKYYSDWYSINEIEGDGPTSYTDIELDPDKQLDIDVEFILKSTPTNWDEDNDYITISEVSSNVTRRQAPPEPQYITPAANVSAIGRQNGLTFQMGHTYNPYALKPAEDLYNDMSYIVNELYGHEVEYVKVTSNDEKGRDVILREWNLYNVKEENIKCMKILVPNNEFPDNKFNFSPYGVDYGDNFEVHIVDSYFKNVFGKDFIPEQKDYLYFPLLNRMYTIKSTYLYRAFNMQPSYWKCTLTKYEDVSNIIYEDEAIHDKILDATNGLDRLFGVEVKEESENLIDEQQLKPTISNLDEIRDYMYPLMKITEEVLDTDYTLVSNSQYDLNSIYSRYDSKKVAVKYAYKYKQGILEDKSIFLWVNPQKVTNNSYNVSVTGTGPYTVTLATGTFPEQYEVGQKVSFYKKGTPKTLKTVMTISTIATDRTYLTATTFDSSITFNLADLELVSLSVERDMILSGTDTYTRSIKARTFSYLPSNYTNGIKTCIIDNHFVYLYYFGQTFSFKLNNPIKESMWYGMVFSINKQNEEVGFYVYERFEEGGKAVLSELYQKTKVGLVASNNDISTHNLYLIDSPLKVTNLRVVSKHVEVDLHSSYLLRKIVDNAHFVDIVDNAYPNTNYNLNK